MAKTWTTKAAVAGAVAVSVLGASARATAAPAATQTVVLHVSDLVGLSTRDRLEAQKRATRVYQRIGVRLVWTNGDAADAPADGALHLDVVVLPRDMADRRSANETELGRAGHLTRHAYIFFSRIEAYAIQTGSDPAIMLATVLAHEIGHMLLPVYSHSPSGLMRAEWIGRIGDVPDFDAQQAETIRSLLTLPDTIAVSDSK